MNSSTNIKKPEDDYYWSSYTDIYKHQIDIEMSDNTLFLIKDSVYDIDANEIIFEDFIHGNAKELYTQATCRPNINSVFECGCGPGHHLRNIKFLKPNLQIFGGELLQTQLDLGKNIFNIPETIYQNIKIVDFTIPLSSCLFDYKYDFVYTQAVIMHLKHANAITFIQNMANISKKYVFMIENWGNHNFPELLKESGILNIYTYQFIQGKYQTYILLTK
jgi:SAM-dependent methyltransferase